MEFLKRHWVALVGLAAASAMAYGQWAYISSIVTPETVCEFAKWQDKQEIRWCFSNGGTTKECLK